MLQENIIKIFVRVAGIAGIGLAVFFVLFSDTLQVFSRQEFDLDPDAAYVLFATCLVLTFGIACLSMVAWMMGKINPRHVAGQYVAITAFVLMFFGVMYAVAFTPITINDRTPRNVEATKSSTTTSSPPPIPSAPSPPPSSPAPVRTIQTALNVCVGQHSGVCGSGWIHLPCGSSVEAWASQACLSAAVTKLGDTGGNRCGYYRARVDCVKALN
ncbi:hypothetical protein [Neorhizobium sp. T25_27]|uniref:hypothetical protein n=1 Tax=Neorhizobium sp. T25_27 TaxID=2093831 RepID=UPI00155E54BA|nr:hypothetical protein [Neorhizobium sp. T25_27]